MLPDAGHCSCTRRMNTTCKSAVMHACICMDFSQPKTAARTANSCTLQLTAAACSICRLCRVGCCAQEGTVAVHADLAVLYTLWDEARPCVQA